MIQYYIEKLLLNLALFFLKLSYLAKVPKYNPNRPSSTHEYYKEWVKEYLKNFKERIQNYEE